MDCEPLASRFEQLLGSIRQAAEGIHNDLEARSAAPEFRELLTGSVYGDLEDCLEEILADRCKEPRAGASLQAAMASLRQSTDTIEQ